MKKPVEQGPRRLGPGLGVLVQLNWDLTSLFNAFPLDPKTLLKSLCLIRPSVLLSWNSVCPTNIISSSQNFLFFKKTKTKQKTHLFIWLCQVLVSSFRVFFFFFFFSFSNCSMWDLVHGPGIEPRSSTLGELSLNHWSTREVPGTFSCVCVWIAFFFCNHHSPDVLILYC